MQRGSVLQLAIQTSRSYHVLAQKSFQLALKEFLTSKIDYSSSVIWILKKQFCLRVRQVKNKIHKPDGKIYDALDYEQFLFLLSPLRETRETRKWPRAWLKARDEKETLLAVY